MILVRTTMMLAVAALVLAVALPVPADDEQDTLRTDWLTFASTLFGSSTPCDQDGVNGVQFCDALRPWTHEDENATHPDRVAISVRDDAGYRLGFSYVFLNESGISLGSLASGSGCGHTHGLVPHTGQGAGGFPGNATHLRVTVSKTGGLFSCNTAPLLTGTVTVTWRYNATVWNDPEWIKD